MEKGENINIDKIGCREFYTMDEFASTIGRTLFSITWGSHAWTKMNKNVLRFKVNAHRHKGHIYVAVNFMDLFDVYLTTTKGKIVKVFTDVYLEDFLNIVDDEIERIDEYVK